jgi:hypothetical protein
VLQQEGFYTQKVGESSMSDTFVSLKMKDVKSFRVKKDWINIKFNSNTLLAELNVNTVTGEFEVVSPRGTSKLNRFTGIGNKISGRGELYTIKSPARILRCSQALSN